jgi:hypothetical protein
MTQRPAWAAHTPSHPRIHDDTYAPPPTSFFSATRQQPQEARIVELYDVEPDRKSDGLEGLVGAFSRFTTFKTAQGVTESPPPTLERFRSRHSILLEEEEGRSMRISVAGTAVMVSLGAPAAADHEMEEGDGYSGMGSTVVGRIEDYDSLSREWTRQNEGDTYSDMSLEGMEP